MSILQDAYMNITPVNAVFNKSNWYLNWSAGANNNLSKFTNPFTHENCSIVGCDHYGALGENTYSIVSGVENVSTLSADRITFNKSAAAVTSPVTIKIASAKNPACQWQICCLLCEHYLLVLLHKQLGYHCS